MSFKKICICLILIFCIIGAASAAEDVSTDVVDASDDAVVVDAVSEDVSDSLESVVVEDEPVVVDSASAQDEIDDVELEASVDDEPALDEVDDELSGQSPILGDKENHDVIYVNVSSSNDRNTVDGQSWENAYGGDRALNFAIQHMNNGGIIYVADGIYNKITNAVNANYTIIGSSRENTIFDETELKSPNCKQFPMNFMSIEPFVTTYVNITFKNPTITLTGDKFFINCTFINASITADKGMYESFIIGDPTQYTIYWKETTFYLNFNTCDFVNYDTAGSVLEAFTTSQINFNKCTFENITANSIVNNTGGFIVDDSINFKDCTFNNVNVKGIVDVPTGTTFGELYSIEGCTGVESYGVVTEDGRDFVNSTKVAVDSVLSGVVNGDSAVITLKDVDGNNIAGAVVSYSINGAEAVNATTDENGQITILGLSGKGSIAVSYEGNDSFKANTTTIEFNIPVSTKITAPKVSATYNVAKNLVITLTDKDGKALANKKVTVKVGTISKTLTTNAKGQVSLNVATLVPKTYTATVKFAGDDGYLASSVSPKVVVSKAKPKITAKAKTFKVKVKTKKYTVTLKNNKGKVLKKVKLTLRVGKKTYKATTNSKGKATFKITKLTKKGKYTATVKFAGSKYYKALSKKVKITVKK